MAYEFVARRGLISLANISASGNVYASNMPQTFNNVAALRSSTVLTNISQSIYVEGYYSPNDGGNGWYYSDPGDTTSADNGTTVITSSNSVRCKPIWVDNIINVKRFGAVGDGKTDDTYAVLSAVALQQLPFSNFTSSTSSDRQGTKVYFPTGVYNISASISGGLDNSTSTTYGTPLFLYGENGQLPIGENILNQSGSVVSKDFTSVIQMTTNNIPVVVISGSSNQLRDLEIRYISQQTGSNASCIYFAGGSAWNNLYNIGLRAGGYGINTAGVTWQLNSNFLYINNYGISAINMPYAGTTNVFTQTYIQNSNNELTTPAFNNYQLVTGSISGSVLTYIVSGSLPAYVQPNFNVTVYRVTSSAAFTPGDVTFNSSYFLNSVTPLTATSSQITMTYSNNTGAPSVPSGGSPVVVTGSSYSYFSFNNASSGPSINIGGSGDVSFVGLDVEQGVVSGSASYIVLNGSYASITDLHLENAYVYNGTGSFNNLIESDQYTKIGTIDVINGGILSNNTGSIFYGSGTNQKITIDEFHTRDFASSGSYLNFYRGANPIGMPRSFATNGTLRANATPSFNNYGLLDSNTVVYGTNTAQTVTLTNVSSSISSSGAWVRIAGTDTLLQSGNVNNNGFNNVAGTLRLNWQPAIANTVGAFEMDYNVSRYGVDAVFNVNRNFKYNALGDTILQGLRSYVSASNIYFDLYINNLTASNETLKYNIESFGGVGTQGALPMPVYASSSVVINPSTSSLSYGINYVDLTQQGIFTAGPSYSHPIVLGGNVTVAPITYGQISTITASYKGINAFEVLGNISCSAFTASVITSSFSGSHYGTSSWANSSSVAVSSQTASYLPVATYNITSSWALNALTSSYVTSSNIAGTVNSASYALSSSISSTASTLITTNNYTVNSLTSTIDNTINGLTVGKGSGSISTNTAFGVSALSNISSSANAQNTAIGYLCMNIISGSTNTAVGYSSMQNAKSSNSNGCVAIGYSTLQGDSPGSQNIAIGKYAGQFINSGSTNNILIGANLFSNGVTTASFAGNIYIGATVNNTSMASASFNYNVVVGYKAGSVTSGSNNILIGGNNTTVIEAPSNGGNNQLNIGNVLYGSGLYGTGKIGVNVPSPVNALDVGGNISCSVVTSSIYAPQAGFATMPYSASGVALTPTVFTGSHYIFVTGSSQLLYVYTGTRWASSSLA